MEKDKIYIKPYDDDYDDDSGSGDNNSGSGLIFNHIREILEYVVTIFNRVFKRLFGYDF